MKNIYSNIFKFNNINLAKAINYLKKNHLIAVPTETVYGLAGNAYSKKAIKKIYNLKNRPKFNPLIIHYSNYKDLSNDVILDKNFFKLYKHFCPGPLTFILKKKKKSKISGIANNNLRTVAVRFPNDKKIKMILKKLDFPLAIPSANKSGGISPVSPKDVSEEFGNKLKMIIDGGACKIGIESTVIDLTKKIRILRPGIIDKNQISKVINNKIFVSKNSKKINSPGLIKKHYSPGIPMRLNQKINHNNHAFIIFGKKHNNKKNTFNLSYKSNLNEAAKNLYKTLRKIKKMKYKKIYVVRIPNQKIGFAINDRLKHAAAK